MADREELTGRQFLIRMFARGFAGLVIAVGAVYALDAGVLRYRVYARRNPYDTVTVRPYYAIPRKDQKTELMFDDPHPETCVNSIFPQVNHLPCWYLRRHPERRIDM